MIILRWNQFRVSHELPRQGHSVGEMRMAWASYCGVSQAAGIIRLDQLAKDRIQSIMKANRVWLLPPPEDGEAALALEPPSNDDDSPGDAPHGAGSLPVASPLEPPSNDDDPPGDAPHAAGAPPASIPRGGLYGRWPASMGRAPPPRLFYRIPPGFERGRATGVGCNCLIHSVLQLRQSCRRYAHDVGADDAECRAIRQEGCDVNPAYWRPTGPLAHNRVRFINRLRRWGRAFWIFHSGANGDHEVHVGTADSAFPTFHVLSWFCHYEPLWPLAAPTPPAGGLTQMMEEVLEPPTPPRMAGDAREVASGEPTRKRPWQQVAMILYDNYF